MLLCDADDIVSDGWVDVMVGAYGENVWLAGVVDYATLNTERTRRQWGAPARSECVLTEPFVDRTFGGNCGIARSMWEALGGFDSRLSGSGDETEFFMRAHVAGYRQRWVPEAIIAYRLRSGFRNMCRQRYRQGRSQVRMQRLSSTAQRSRLDPKASRLAVAKLLLASPKYVLRSGSRYAWLAAMSRHLGRLSEQRRPAP